MPIEIKYRGDQIHPNAGMIQLITNPKVCVIPSCSVARIDTGQTIYLPYRATCTLQPNPAVLTSRGLIVIGNLYIGPSRANSEDEVEHQIVIVGFNLYEMQINVMPGDPLGWLVFGQTVPVRLAKR